MAERLDPEVRRLRILDAAMEIIADEGYRGLSLRGLSRRCGMSAPGLMHYFPTMPQLLMEVLAHRDRLDAAAVRTNSPEESGREVFDRIVEGIIAKPQGAQLFAMVEAEALDPAHPAYDYFRERVDRITRDMLPVLSREYAEPDALARRVWAIMDGLQLQWLRDRDGFDLRGHWNAIADPLFAAAPRVAAGPGGAPPLPLADGGRGRGPRPVTSAMVARTEVLTPTMVRVVLTGEELRTLPEITFTDAHVKLHFGDALRAYTIRSFDRERNEMAIDFVIHGDEGLAGPWAASTQPGDTISFVGPGGAWSPRPDADAHLLVGDESALPAIASALEALPASARVDVFLEVASAASRQPLRLTDHTTVTWVDRDEHGRGYGEALVEAVLAAPFPDGDVEAFVHGNAEMVRPLRRYLLRDRGLDRSRVSISGYWRAGHTDESWRATKREFNAAMEAEL